MIDSIESERLDRLIKSKVERYKKMKDEDPENKALPYLNSEIAFLQNTIMPIVLSETTLDYSEIRNFVTRSIRKLERHPLSRKTTDLILHIHIKDADDGETPIAAIAQSRSDRQIDFELFVNCETSQQYWII